MIAHEIDIVMAESPILNTLSRKIGMPRFSGVTLPRAGMNVLANQHVHTAGKCQSVAFSISHSASCRSVGGQQQPVPCCRVWDCFPVRETGARKSAGKSGFPYLACPPRATNRVGLKWPNSAFFREICAHSMQHICTSHIHGDRIIHASPRRPQ